MTSARGAVCQFANELLAESLIDGVVPAYDDFLEQRRKLMALKIKTWFKTL